jgi:hypothetical protein
MREEDDDDDDGSSCGLRILLVEECGSSLVEELDVNPESISLAVLVVCWVVDVRSE